MTFSLKQLEELKAAGKIKDFRTHSKKHSGSAAKNIPVKKGNKTKDWIAKNLSAWASGNKLELKTEHKFHPVRKWRFDWAFPDKMIAIEYEGLMSEKSRHTTISGFTGDADKYNAAQQLGWKVLRYTAKNYKNIISDLDKILK